MEFNKRRCPRCKKKSVVRTGEGYWCQACSTELVRRGRRLREIEILCSRIGATVSASFCRGCWRSERCIAEQMSSEHPVGA